MLKLFKAWTNDALFPGAVLALGVVMTNSEAKDKALSGMQFGFAVWKKGKPSQHKMNKDTFPDCPANYRKKA